MDVKHICEEVDTGDSIFLGVTSCSNAILAARFVVPVRNSRYMINETLSGVYARNALQEEAQPMYTNYPFGVCLAHNGNLTNVAQLKESVFAEARHINTDSVSQLAWEDYSLCYRGGGDGEVPFKTLLLLTV